MRSILAACSALVIVVVGIGLRTDVALAQAPAPSSDTSAAPAKSDAPAVDPAADVRTRLDRKGVIDGRNWSVSLQLTETALGNVLDFIAEAARAKPRDININVDRVGIEAAGVSLDDPITLSVHEVSIGQALRLVLPDELATVICDDGTVLVTSQARAEGFARGGVSRVVMVRPTAAAAATAAKLKRSGVFEGQKWAISLSVTEVSLGNFLDLFEKAARDKPREIDLSVDRAAIKESGISLDDPITLHLRDLSVDQTLALVSPDSLAVVIADDGKAVLTTRNRATTLPPLMPVTAAQTEAARKTLSRALGRPAEAPTRFDLALHGATVAEALTRLRDDANKAKPPISMKLPSLAGPVFSRPVTCWMGGLTLGQALAAVLPPELEWAVTDDGAVLVTEREKPASGGR